MKLFPPSPLAQSAPVSSHNPTSKPPGLAEMNSGKQHMLGFSAFICILLSPPLLPETSFLLSRLGQEPPPTPQEDAYDGRSLAEVRTCHPTHRRFVLVILLTLSLETRRQSRKSRAVSGTTPCPSTPSCTPLGNLRQPNRKNGKRRLN